MADVVTKSVRLMDKEVRLYPRVKLEDIVKSVTADGTETVVKLVEQSNNENIVYGTKVTGGLLQQATITYSESLKGSTIPVRTAGGMLLVENPSSDTPQAAVNLLYANTNYGRLGAGNDWTGLNRFGAEKISVHATDNSIYMKLAEQGFFIKTGPSSEEYFVKLPDLAGTLTTEAALNSSAASTLSSAKSYTDTQINAKLSSALKYKGSKDTYADLPKTGNQVGDVWNVVAAYGNAHAGTNWAWNGTVWDPLGGTIDLTNYVTAPAAFTTGGMLVEVSGTGTGRIIKQSTYAAGAMSANNHPAAMLPNADSVYTYVNSKISGSIWDSTKVVYAKASDTNTSWAVTTPHILVSETDESGHILAREGYVINNENLAKTNDQIPTSKVVSDAIDGPIGVLQSSKLDKKVTAGEYAYVHNSATQTEYKLYGGLSSTIPGGAIPYTAPDGALAAETTGVSFLSSTATGIAVSVASTALKKLINGSILQSLVNSINTSLSLINNSLITYEEVS
jgi:hypothetical protein